MLPGGKYKHNSNNHLEAQEFVILGTEGKPSLFDYFIHTDKYVCYEGKDPRQAVSDLIERPVGAEDEPLWLK